MSSKTFGWVVGGKGTLTVYVGSRVYTAAVDHPNYKRVAAALKEATTPAKEARVEKLLNVPYALNAFTKGFAEIRNGEVYVNGVVMNDNMTLRIVEVMNAGLPFAPMLRFFENVLMNPSPRSRKELYQFLEHRLLPITEDGCFLGYKKVKNDLFDWHSGKFNNAVGQVHAMPRENVDPDCKQHCSTGFHVGTIEYADKHFHAGQGKIVIVKVNPADAVSVPEDYTCQKIRVCKYEVVKEYVGNLEAPVYGSRADHYVAPEVADDDSDFEDEVPYYDDDVDLVDLVITVQPRSEKAKADKAAKAEEVKYHNKRDSSGRFAPKKRR